MGWWHRLDVKAPKTMLNHRTMDAIAMLLDLRKKRMSTLGAFDLSRIRSKHLAFSHCAAVSSRFWASVYSYQYLV
jgi:hypothetical protein